MGERLALEIGPFLNLEALGDTGASAEDVAIGAVRFVLKITSRSSKELSESPSSSEHGTTPFEILEEDCGMVIGGVDNEEVDCGEDGEEDDCGEDIDSIAALETKPVGRGVVESEDPDII